MKASRLTRWGFTVAVVALAAVAFAQWRADQRAAPGALLALDPNDVTRIDLQIGPGPAQHYVRAHEGWQAVDGTTGKIDDGRLDELAATAAAPVLSWRPAGDFDPARIGLSPPLATLALNGQQLEFGETSVTGPQRYVRVGERVALVGVRYTPRPVQATATP